MSMRTELEGIPAELLLAEDFDLETSDVNGSDAANPPTPPMSAALKESKVSSSLELSAELHVTPLAEFQCGSCWKVFASRKGLRSHSQRRCGAIDRPFICAVCLHDFVSLVHLRVHMTNIHAAVAVDCSQCGKTFSSKISLGKHNKTVHASNNLHPCPACQKQFTSPFYLKEHLRTHTGEKPFQCPYCAKAFARNSVFKDHVSRVHHVSVYRPDAKTGWNVQSRNHGCANCTRSFASKQLLDVHVKSVHLERARCALCNAQFNTVCGLTRHQHSKHPEQASCMRCAQCAFTCVKRNEMVQHMRSHSGFDISHPELYLFGCHFCGKACLVARVYRKHMNGHKLAKGARRILCPVCSASFGSAMSFSFHMSLHLYDDGPGKLYKCSHCLLSFGCAERLFAHLCLHSDRKPFRCNVCSNDFAVRSNDFIEHANSVHRNKSQRSTQCYHCTLCLATFTERRKLYAHFLEHPEVIARRR